MGSKINMADIYSRIHFPQMRQILIFALKNLSNKEAQMKEWVSSTAAHRFWDTMKFDIDVIYNDLNLHENPEDQLGYSLVSQEEIDVMQSVIKALDAVYDQIGPKQPDSAYINSPLWDEVVESAQAALEVFLANEEEARKINPHPWSGEQNWGDVSSNSTS